MEKNIEERIIKLVNSFSDLSEEEKNETIEFANYNECGVAFDGLCYVINDRDIPITKDQYEEIVSLGTDMNMDKATWLKLKELIKI